MNREKLRRLIADPCSAPGVRPTVQGYRFILLTLLLALAAVNTANNLIYLILAMIAAMMIVSLFTLPRSLNGLNLTLRTPFPVHAGMQTSLTVSIRREFQRPILDVHVRLPEETSGGIDSRARIGRIEGQGAQECTLPFRPSRRGRFRVGDLLLSTGFPFGLIMKTRILRQDRSVLVYPALRKVQNLSPLLSRVSAGTETSRPGQEGSYLFDREYRHGDSLRHVHWKATARTGRLLVKEYSTEEPVRVTLYLETGPDVSDVLFEKAVSTTASIAALLSENGTYIRLVCGNSESGFGTGREHLYGLMDTLALVSAASSPAPVPGTGAGYLIAVSSGPIRKGGAGPFDLVIDAEQEI